MKKVKPLKIFLLVSGIFMIIVSGVILFNGLVERKIFENGDIVEIQFLKCTCYSAKLAKPRCYLRFKFEGEFYSKKIKKSYCQNYNPGDFLQAKANEDRSAFVLPNEIERDKDWLYGYLLLGLSLFILYKSIKM